MQDGVRRYEKPDVAFFSRLNLPPHIPRLEISMEVGRSVLKDGQWQDLRYDVKSEGKRWGIAAS